MAPSWLLKEGSFRAGQKSWEKASSSWSPTPNRPSFLQRWNTQKSVSRWSLWTIRYFVILLLMTKWLFHKILPDWPSHLTPVFILYLSKIQKWCLGPKSSVNLEFSVHFQKDQADMPLANEHWSWLDKGTCIMTCTLTKCPKGQQWHSWLHFLIISRIIPL